MSNNSNAWFFSVQDQLHYQYDEHHDQLVYENGITTARPPYVSREHLTGAVRQNFYDYDRNPPPAFNYPEARHSPNAPRTWPLYSGHPDPQPEASSPTRAYVHRSGRALGPHMNSLPHASPVLGTYTTNAYGYHGIPDAATPSWPSGDIANEFQRSMTLGAVPLPHSYHPKVAIIRQNSQGASVMQVHDTTRAMQPSSQNVNETERTSDPTGEPVTSSPAESSATLNPKFKRVQKSKKFFVMGKVFITLWAEPAGDVGDSSKTMITDGISAGSFGEPVFCKIRRFVVVREGDHACSALPIITYGHQGVSKKGVNKSEHAIIYTGKKAPQPLSIELPERGERGLLPQSIRVDPDDPETKLDPLSRLDFAKVYTIEHNVKVRSVGKVNRTSMQPLLYQFKTVWSKVLGESESQTHAVLPQQNRTIGAETSASASASRPELIAAYNALLACGLTAEQARAPLLQAGFQLSSPATDQRNEIEDDPSESIDRSEGIRETPEGLESVPESLPDSGEPSTF